MRRIRKVLQTLLSAYMVVASLVLAGLAGTGLLLWKQGVLDTATLQRIGKVIRREPLGDEKPVEVYPEKFAQDMKTWRKSAEEEVERRRLALTKEEQDFTLVTKKEIRDREAAVEAARTTEEAKEKAFAAELAEREAALSTQEEAKKKADLKLDVDLLSRLDPKQSAKLLLDMRTKDKEAGTDRALRLIHSLRPRIVADIFAEMLADPKTQDAALELQDQLTKGPAPAPVVTENGPPASK